LLLAGVPWFAAFAYAAIVAWHGIPAMRHDWIWPRDRADAYDLFVRSTSGWDPHAIGALNLYLNDYLIGSALALLTIAFGAHGSLAVFALGVGLACTFGAASLARVLGAPAVGQATAALFALYNPWAYTETVAGHTYMLLAYGATMSLVAELLRERPRAAPAAMLVVLSLQQLQFFAAACIFAVYLGLRKKTWLPLVTALAIAAPVAVSSVLEFDAYRSVPYTLAWETSQSVAPVNALELSGYFAGYGGTIDYLDRWLMAVLIAVVAYGFALRIRSREAQVSVIVTALCVALAAGLKGPLAWFERFAVIAIPPWAAFRELYDLLGFAAAGYVAGLSFAVSTSRIARVPALAAAGALALAWLIWTPWAWWVPAAEIPAVNLDLASGSRFALTPAFQPLQFEGRGSGLDPDARIQAGDVAPLNASTPSYPMDAALARFTTRGDTSSLAALGVSQVIVRPWLASDAQALARQLPSPFALRETQPRHALPIAAAPPLALLGIPPTCSVCTRLGAGAVFFGDVAGLSGAGVPAAWSGYARTSEVVAPRRSVDAARDWVDARLAFAADPEIAQAFGGALTIAPRALLAVEGGARALVFVRGSLVSERGEMLTSSTAGYRWIAIPQDVSAVRCSGLCVVAARGNPPVGADAESTVQPPITPLDGRAWLPWLWSAQVPPGSSALLRLNVAYDPHWTAYAPGVSAPHFRVDAVVNGWLLGPRGRTQTVWLVQTTAALAALFEIAGAVLVLALLVVVAAGALRDARRTAEAAERTLHA
jgi:hypothetical protein